MTNAVDTLDDFGSDVRTILELVNGSVSEHACSDGEGVVFSREVDINNLHMLQRTFFLQVSRKHIAVFGSGEEVLHQIVACRKCYGQQ